MIPFRIDYKNMNQNEELQNLAEGNIRDIDKYSPYIFWIDINASYMYRHNFVGRAPTIQIRAHMKGSTIVVIKRAELSSKEDIYSVWRRAFETLVKRLDTFIGKNPDLTTQSNNSASPEERLIILN